MDFTEKTIQRDVKYSGRIFTVTQDIVELPNGKTSTRDLVFHTGAVAVLVIRDGKMLLVRQYRKPLEMHFLEIPAGKLDSKEEVPLEAAKRELEEETNLVAKEWVKMMEMVSTPGFCDEKITLFQAKNVTVKEDTVPRIVFNISPIGYSRPSQNRHRPRESSPSRSLILATSCSVTPSFLSVTVDKAYALFIFVKIAITCFSASL